jgi:hypothetical protein
VVQIFNVTQTHLAIGQILASRYRIVRHLGGGGFAQTYLAEDIHLPEHPACVVKQLQPLATDIETLQVARRLFETEVRVLYHLGHHPQIPQLMAHFEENQEFYLVEEFVEGHDLARELQSGKPLSESYAIALLNQILTVLTFVHQQRIIHRDIKPENLIRRTSDGQIALIDFGSVKQIGTQMLTPHGAVRSTVRIGTPGYLPVEQARGKPQFSSDVYAAGILAIQALTGLSPDRLPEDPRTGEIRWRDRVTVNPKLANLIDNMTRYDHRLRYPSAVEALEALQPLLAPTPLPAIRQTRSPSASSIPTARTLKVSLRKTRRLLKRILPKLLLVVGIGGLAIQVWGLVPGLATGSAVILTFAFYKKLPRLVKGFFRRIFRLIRWFVFFPFRAIAFVFKLAVFAVVATIITALFLDPGALVRWGKWGIQNIPVQRAFERLYRQMSDRVPNQYFNSILPTDWQNEGKKYIENFDVNSFQAWQQLGETLHKLQRYKDAIAAYQNALQLQPTETQTWKLLGDTLYELGRYQEAIAAYQKALELQPNFTEAETALQQAIAANQSP